MTWRINNNQPSLSGRLLQWLLLLAALAVAGPTAAATEITSLEDAFSEEAIGAYLDEYHTYLLAKIKGPTIWFDNFFGDQRVEEDDLPASFVRLRMVAHYTEGEGITFPIRVRANLDLPKVNRRLRLIIFGGNREEDRLRQSNNNFDPNLLGAPRDESQNLGLRYLIYKNLRDRFDFGGGLNLNSPAGYNGRMRYERLIQISPLYITRITETGFWDSQVGLGETSRLDFEKTLTPQITGRFSLSGTFSDDKPNFQWGAEINLFRQLSTESALAFDLDAYCDGIHTGKVSLYRTAGRYRRNFLRPWLFFEIEPEMIFPIVDGGGRKTIGLLTTTLEIQFVT